MSWKSYLQYADKDERSFNQRMAAMLAHATKTPVSERDFVAWAGDDAGSCLAGCGKVDKLVRRYMGPLYEQAECAARMLPVLEAKLKGRKTVTSGGARFTGLQSKRA